ncbi:MAG: hypothetical protein E5Y58_25750 [Mesorhizobium sp.]|nr:MAG: hypothetical protein E5Y58_25750 [Mesorhizobium sp.]
MIETDTLASTQAFSDADKSQQAEMLLWAMTCNDTGKSGIAISDLRDQFGELGLAKPNPTRLKDHFRKSRNVRSVNAGRYSPTREFSQHMKGQFGETLPDAMADFEMDKIPLPPFVAPERRADLARMLPVYAQLFLLENSMRGLIEKVLSEHLGPDWWEHAANSSMKKKNADRSQNEQTKRWAPTRSEFGPLYALDWTDLITLMRKFQPQFEKYIGEISFLHRYDDAGTFRNIVAHNGALRNQDDFDIIGIYYRAWIKQTA